VNELQKFILNHSQLPERFQNICLDDLRDIDPLVLRKVKEWIKQKNLSGIYIHSISRGVGKTCLAAAIANELVRQGRVKKQLSFFGFPSLVSSVAYPFNSMEYDDYLSRFANSEFFVLDDISAMGKMNLVMSVATYRIISRLHAEKKVVAITSNLPLSKLAGMYEENGWNIASRICEMCPTVFDLTITGTPSDDLRTRRKK